VDLHAFDLPPLVPGLAAALVIGLLIGLERGWSARERAEGQRVAGLRTFSLIGLTGGVLGSLGPAVAPWGVAAGLIALSLLLAVSYREAVRAEGDLSATTAVAALLTCALGALAAGGHALSAVAAAVVAAMLLDYKSALHRWLQLVEHSELRAALQMGVLSVVVLPLLPDAGYGPHGALNPYRLWWAVVLLAGLSLAGHVTMRLSGPQRGVLLTGLLGGLATSTAATLTLARRAGREPALREVALAGSLASSGVMYLRILAIVSVLQPALGRGLALPLAGSAATLFGLAGWLWWRRSDTGPAPNGHGEVVAPFDLGTIIGFGVLLAVVVVVVEAAKAWFGAAGVYVVSALSGLVDVDPVVVSLARLQGAGIVADVSQVAVVGIGVAIVANMVTKLVMAGAAGGLSFSRGLVGGYLLSLAAGGVLAAVSGV
jgi:uncharacterized membrane protein (DUF4010 family)